MDFKAWVTPFIKEMFVPGTYATRQKDLTNVGMGVRSKYIGPDETGEEQQSEKPADIADFGIDNNKEREEQKKLRKLKRLKSFLKQQGRDNGLS